MTPPERPGTMFGIGISELVLIAVVALIVVGPKNLPVTLRAIGRAIGEFKRASKELRREVGLDEVVNEVARPLREGMADVKGSFTSLESDIRNYERDEEAFALSLEYPEGGPDDYGALPEGAAVYADLAASGYGAPAKKLPPPPPDPAWEAARDAKLRAADDGAGGNDPPGPTVPPEWEAARSAKLQGTVARGKLPPDDDGPAQG